MRLRREAQRKQTEAKRNELLQEIRKRLCSDFLSAASYFRISRTDLISVAEFEQETISFVKSWVAENAASPDQNGQRCLPDNEQRWPLQQYTATSKWWPALAAEKRPH